MATTFKAETAEIAEIIGCITSSDGFRAGAAAARRRVERPQTCVFSATL